MSRTILRRHPRLALAAAAAVVLTALFFLAVPAQAADGVVGWTIEQNGKRYDYPRDDRWNGTATPSGFTMRNESTGEKVYYYGTFRVLEREK